MIILPAIDIKNGQCVRLTKGDFATTEKVAEDPVKTAQSFQNSGAAWLHMVDLDGAVAGSLVNRDIFTRVAAATGLQVEIGGGIRNMESIDFYLENGISRVIIGSAALSDPQMTKAAIEKYGDKIAIGIDAKEGKVSVSGWLKESDVDYIEMAKRMEDLGAATIIYTDISKDGTLSGPNLEQLARINEAVRCQIIASGGIHVKEDIKRLAQLGLYGAICGKSLYKGTLDLKEAIQIAAENKED